MNADDLYTLIQPNLKKLNRTEKRKLYSRIFSEAHPAFYVKKWGKTRSLLEVKERLKRNFRIALLEERGQS